MERIGVLLADDHPVVRQGLRTLLELQDDIELVGEAADGAEAVARAEELLPDVVLIDLVMPELDGVEALRCLRAASPATRVIVLTSFGDDARIFPAIKAGAAGYLLKDVEPQELLGDCSRESLIVKGAASRFCWSHVRRAGLRCDLFGGPMSALPPDRDIARAPAGV